MLVKNKHKCNLTQVVDARFLYSTYIMAKSTINNCIIINKDFAVYSLN